MLKGMSARDKNALILLFTIILAALSYLYLYEPILIDIQSNNAQLGPKENQNNRVKHYANKKESLDIEIQENTDKLGNLDLQLPNNYNTAELLYLLHLAAKEKNIELIKFEEKQNELNATSKIADADFFNCIVTVKGNIGQIQGYIEELEKLKRSVNVIDMKIEKGYQDVYYTATITITPFYLKDNPNLKYERKQLIQ